MDQKHLIICMRLLYCVHMHVTLLITLEAKDILSVYVESQLLALY